MDSRIFFAQFFLYKKHTLTHVIFSVKLKKPILLQKMGGRIIFWRTVYGLVGTMSKSPSNHAPTASFFRSLFSLSPFRLFHLPFS